MGLIQDTLNPLEGHLISIERDTVNGWYEIKVGIYGNWVYSENKEIACEVILDKKDGKVIKIKPKNNNITVDELLAFFEIIIETNKKIAEKEKEFKDRMEKIKQDLEGEAKKFYEELDSLKEDSFKNVNNKFIDKLNKNKETEINDTDDDDDDKPKVIKRGRGRPSKSQNSQKNDE